MELRWLVPHQTSFLHAAEAVSCGQMLTSPALAAALEEPVAGMRSLVAEAAIVEPTFWQYILPLSPAYDQDRHLARMTLYRCLDVEASRSPLVEALVDAISRLREAYREQLPRVELELPLRVGPLREAWESRGPGLLRGIARETDLRLLAPQADVLLVHPVVGGGGAPHRLYGSVRIEGMLANPHPQLPESVRLAWLLAQLNADLPILAGEVSADRLPATTAAAMLIPTLAAAADLDLVQFSRELLQTAIACWRVPHPAGVELTVVLTQWWNAYCQARPPWDVAFAALDDMLQSAENEAAARNN